MNTRLRMATDSPGTRSAVPALRTSAAQRPPARSVIRSPWSRKEIPKSPTAGSRFPPTKMLGLAYIAVDNTLSVQNTAPRRRRSWQRKDRISTGSFGVNSEVFSGIRTGRKGSRGKGILLVSVSPASTNRTTFGWSNSRQTAISRSNLSRRFASEGPLNNFATYCSLRANIDETESAAIITEQGGQENHRERSQDGSSFCNQFA